MSLEGCKYNLSKSFENFQKNLVREFEVSLLTLANKAIS